VTSVYVELGLVTLACRASPFVILLALAAVLLRNGSWG
jgi:hypothetical protein